MQINIRKSSFFKTHFSVTNPTFVITRVRETARNVTKLSPNLLGDHRVCIHSVSVSKVDIGHSKIHGNNGGRFRKIHNPQMLPLYTPSVILLSCCRHTTPVEDIGHHKQCLFSLCPQFSTTLSQPLHLNICHKLFLSVSKTGHNHTGPRLTNIVDVPIPHNSIVPTYLSLPRSQDPMLQCSTKGPVYFVTDSAPFWDSIQQHSI
jgi:hypothetical protein